MWKLHKILKIYLIICKGRCGIELNIGWYIYAVGGVGDILTALSSAGINDYEKSIHIRIWMNQSGLGEWELQSIVNTKEISALSIFHLFSYKSSQGENINYFLPVLNIFIQEESLNSYKFQLTLTIKSLQPEDFGTYRCISKNSIGQAEEVVELYGEILNIKYGVIWGI